jgi:hypothetical protein
MSDEQDPTRDGVSSDAPTPVSRRAALKVLGAVPVAGALIGGSAFRAAGHAAAAVAAAAEADARDGVSSCRGAPARIRRRNERSARSSTAAEVGTVECARRTTSFPRRTLRQRTDAGGSRVHRLPLSGPEQARRRRGRDARARLAHTESRKRFKKNYASLSADQRTRSSTTSLAEPSQAGVQQAPPSSPLPRLRRHGFFSSAQGRNLCYEGNVFNPNWQGVSDPR